MAATIQSVKARQIFDSRGNPTVEVRTCWLIHPVSTSIWSDRIGPSRHGVVILRGWLISLQDLGFWNIF
jgi:hypothetical protein